MLPLHFACRVSDKIQKCFIKLKSSVSPSCYSMQLVEKFVPKGKTRDIKGSPSIVSVFLSNYSYL